MFNQSLACVYGEDSWTLVPTSLPWSRLLPGTAMVRGGDKPEHARTPALSILNGESPRAPPRRRRGFQLNQGYGDNDECNAVLCSKTGDPGDRRQRRNRG